MPILQDYLHYLGPRISADGLKPLPEKLEAIRNLAPTKNIYEACQILGLLGYYRSFVPAFSDITLPITSLLKKNTPFVWSEKCQLALDYLQEMFCNKVILQFPDPNKPYVFYTDASNNAYSSVLCQSINDDNDIRPVAYFSGTFTAQNKSWCATEREAYAVLKSIQRFNYYIRGTTCILRCDHKPLEPFLNRGMKIAKLDRWAMLLEEYDITFVHIRGKDNILADAISRLCTINVYNDAVENKHHHSLVKQDTAHSSRKAKNIELLDSATPLQTLSVSNTTLRNLQKQDKFCKNRVCELHTNINDKFYLDNDNILKCKIIVNNLEVDITVTPSTLTCILMHKFHNCRGHQGCARTFNLLKRKFWWKGMRRDVRNHINSCIICSKNLPNTSYHPQLHLEIPKVPFACIAIDTIQKLQVTTSGNRYVLTYIDLLTSYVIAVPMPDKTAVPIVEVYLSGILSRTGASMVCLSDNGSELRNRQMNMILKQLGIKCIFSNPYRPQGKLHIKMYIISLKDINKVFIKLRC